MKNSIYKMMIANIGMYIIEEAKKVEKDPYRLSVKPDIFQFSTMLAIGLAKSKEETVFDIANFIKNKQDETK